VVHWELFLFAAFFFKPEQKPFPGRIIIFDLQIHDGADPGESVGQDPEQSAIAETGMRGWLDRVEKLLDFTFDERRRFAFGPRESLGLDFPGRIQAKTPFSVSQENSIRMAAMCCLTVGGAAWRCRVSI
jgi:hypothetical protein